MHSNLAGGALAVCARWEWLGEKVAFPRATVTDTAGCDGTRMGGRVTKGKRIAEEGNSARAGGRKVKGRAAFIWFGVRFVCCMTLQLCSFRRFNERRYIQPTLVSSESFRFLRPRAMVPALIRPYMPRKCVPSHLNYSPKFSPYLKVLCRAKITFRSSNFNFHHRIFGLLALSMHS